MTWKQLRPKEIRGKRNKTSVITDLFLAIEDQVSSANLQNTIENSRHAANDVVAHCLNHRKKYIENGANTNVECQSKLKLCATDLLTTAMHKPQGNIAADSNRMMVRKRKANTSACSYWEKKGHAVAANTTRTMGCAECSAFIVHILRARPDFNLPLSIIEQSQGMIDSHFWLVAGTIDNPTGHPNYGEHTFTIDLWGLATKNIKRNMLAIGPPATMPFSMKTNNEPNDKLTILCTWEADGTPVLF